MDAPRAQRIEFLDSIRGLAALAVLLSHGVGVLVAPPIVVPLLQTAWLHPLIDGKAAVAMFFVLSGFVLSRPYLKKSDAAGPRPILLIPFYIKRVTRIYFPFFAVLCISALASRRMFWRWQTSPPQTDWFNHFWSVPWTPIDFLKQCFFLLHDASRQFMVQDWSLGVELKASALLPFFLFAHRRSAWLLGSIWLGLFYWHWTGYYYAGFVLGIFLAANGEELIAKIHRQNFGFKCLMLIAGLVLYDTRNVIYAVSGSFIPERWSWLAISFGCVMILLACFSSRRIQRGLQHRWAVFLGRISYGVYLVQFLVLLVVTPWVVVLLNRAGLRSPMAIWWLGLLVSTVGTIVLGAIFYQAVERPSMQFGHFIAARFGPSRGMNAPPLSTAPIITRKP